MTKSVSINAGSLWTVTFRHIHCIHNEEDVFAIKLHNIIGCKEFGKPVYYMTISYTGETVTVTITRSKNDTRRRKIICGIDESISILKKYVPLEILLLIAHQNC